MGAHIKRAAGKACTDCASPPAHGHRRCAPHLAERRALEARQRADRRAAGLCVTCGRGAVPGLSLCAHHREYYRARDESRRAGA